MQSGAAGHRFWIGVALLPVALMLLAGLPGCGRHGKGGPEGGSDLTPAQTKLKRGVELTQARQEQIDVFVETSGYLEAEGQTPIGAGVAGIVDEVLFREGQWVDADTILVKIDQRRYEAAAAVARANVVRAEAAVTLARDLAQRDIESGRATSDADRARTGLGLRIAQAEMASARAARDLAEHNLRRSQVRAPYPGQINQRMVTPGTYLEEKTVIGTIADERRIRLVGWVPEKAAHFARELMARQEPARAARLIGAWLGSPPGTAASGALWTGLAGQSLECSGRLPIGATIFFRLGPFPKHEFKARIFYLSRVANLDTHMFECKAEIEALATMVDGKPIEMKPGYTARIKCQLRSEPNAITIPEESVRASERGFIAFVPEHRRDRDGKPALDKDGNPVWIAKARTLELGYRPPGEGKVEVLSGLEAGRWVVSRGAEALEDGTPIEFPPEQLEQLLQQR
jgi:RND family efflux transporter MFP subunit